MHRPNSACSSPTCSSRASPISSKSNTPKIWKTASRRLPLAINRGDKRSPNSTNRFRKNSNAHTRRCAISKQNPSKPILHAKNAAIRWSSNGVKMGTSWRARITRRAKIRKISSDNPMERSSPKKKSSNIAANAQNAIARWSSKMGAMGGSWRARATPNANTPRRSPSTSNAPNAKKARSSSNTPKKARRSFMVATATPSAIFRRGTNRQTKCARTAIRAA